MAKGSVWGKNGPFLGLAGMAVLASGCVRELHTMTQPSQGKTALVVRALTEHTAEPVAAALVTVNSHRAGETDSFGQAVVSVELGRESCVLVSKGDKRAIIGTVCAVVSAGETWTFYLP